ncbi:hypothetical protein GTY81_29350 [Streptomyces sp. SID8366]|uniref:hypothetical protein n=1 Tax=unclassified Streptomyces TaxID=2593676 RepID=UPI000DB9F81E|nr:MULTISPECIES: hypothetical protein [unclassified Streptomyces]MYU07901.1 hypothetical protein [Streptomyces sp. SID8366]MYU61630.1 hypothetical protein [Streptomyces sp. SID69]RAJ52243.1 hypothetical protein K376_06080 [Streptomyces sp. PsTaAH-130]
MVTVVAAVLAAAVLVAPAARAAPERPVAGAAVSTAAVTDAAGRSYTATTVTGNVRTTLRFTLNGGPKLSRAEWDRIGARLGLGRGGLRAAPDQAARTGTAKRPSATLRCDKNPSWSDANGTLAARFNCHHSTINWGFRISARVRSVITGHVRESGVSWWRNGRRMPKNAGHVVGSGYHFHGTLKPVRHADHVQFQDYMTFRVTIGGRPGTGSLTWAADVTAKK